MTGAGGSASTRPLAETSLSSSSLGFFTRCLTVLTTWLPPQWVPETKQGTNYSVFHVVDAWSLLSYLFVPSESRPCLKGEGLTSISRRKECQRSCGHILRPPHCPSECGRGAQNPVCSSHFLVPHSILKVFWRKSQPSSKKGLQPLLAQIILNVENVAGESKYNVHRLV